MNFIVTILLPLLSLANGPKEIFMTKAEQTSFMESKAKEIRRGYHIRNFDDVTSSTRWMSRSDLDSYYKDKDTYENFFSKDEVSDLYRCVAKDNCELYLVSVSGSYHGGYGQDAHFVLLYTQSKKSFTLIHTVYSE